MQPPIDTFPNLYPWDWQIWSNNFEFLN